MKKKQLRDESLAHGSFEVQGIGRALCRLQGANTFHHGK